MSPARFHCATLLLLFSPSHNFGKRGILAVLSDSNVAITGERNLTLFSFLKLTERKTVIVCSKNAEVPYVSHREGVVLRRICFLFLFDCFISVVVFTVKGVIWDYLGELSGVNCNKVSGARRKFVTSSPKDAAKVTSCSEKADGSPTFFQYWPIFYDLPTSSLFNIGDHFCNLFDRIMSVLLSFLIVSETAARFSTSSRRS